MKNINTRTLKGFKELLPAEQMEFNRMLNIIKDTYELHGFIPLDTPVLERAETLLAKAGGETEKQIYQFTKGKTNYAMRFDHTVPLARYVAEHERELAFPFRRYAIGKVYRGERPQAGRLREFYQCDIDIVDKDILNLNADTEIPNIIHAIFSQMLTIPFTIRVNNRKILNGFYESLNVDKVTTMRIVDKLDKIGKEGITKELAQVGIEQAAINKILSFLSITGTNDEILAKLISLDISDTLFIEGVHELAEVITEKTQIDLSIARGLDYYTGTVYETTLNEYPKVGSICSGGRYDDLASTYTNSALPGVGISIGLSRLFDQLKNFNLLKIDTSTPTMVLVIPSTDKLDSKTDILVKKLRESNSATEVFLTTKLNKAMKYANKLGIPYVVIIGESEIAQNKYTLKNMKTGEQFLLDREEIIRSI